MQSYKIKVRGVLDGEMRTITHNYKTDLVFEDDYEFYNHCDKISFGKLMMDEYYFSMILDYKLYVPKPKVKKLTVKQVIDYLNLPSRDKNIFYDNYKSFRKIIHKLPAEKQVEIVFQSIELTYNMLGESSRKLLPKIEEVPFILKEPRANNHNNYYGKPIKFDENREIFKKLKEEFSGKRILFIENDGCLSNDIGDFYQFILNENIEHYIIFNAKDTPLEIIVQKINEYDMIVYQSQYVHDTTYKLINYVKELKTPKIILECYIHEPKWYYNIPPHQIYILSTNEDLDDWNFYKLDEHIAYWDFDKEVNNG